MIHTREDFLQFVRLIAAYNFEWGKLDDGTQVAACRYCGTLERVANAPILTLQHKDTCPILQARVIVKAMEAGTDEQA